MIKVYSHQLYLKVNPALDWLIYEHIVDKVDDRTEASAVLKSINLLCDTLLTTG
jgi:hypothetical protein